MRTTGEIGDPSRRNALKSAAIIIGSQIIPVFQQAFAATRPTVTIRDRLWIWGMDPGAYDGRYNMPGTSRITAVEAAHYMRIPNVLLIRHKGKPTPPFEQYAVPFQSLREVVWSIVDTGGVTVSAVRDAVLKLASDAPNITGVIMDDFFSSEKNGRIASLTVEELEKLQQKLKGSAKRLDLWVVLYTSQLEDPVVEHLKLCDVVTLWTWKLKDLENLPSDFEKAEKLTPHARRVLGCFMWDFGDSKPMPIPAMQRRVEWGLQWLKQGRLDGIIFGSSFHCDRGLETVEWTRQWIERVGSQTLTQRKRSGP